MLSKKAGKKVEKGDYSKILKITFALLRFEMKGKMLGDDKNLITPETLSAVYKLSKKHDLAHLITDALDKNGFLPDDLSQKQTILQERNMAVCRYEQQKYEFDEFCRTLEEAKIPFIPLKGVVLRGSYPEPWMRTSCDIDVFVRKEDLQKAISLLIEKNKYRCDSIGEYDAQLYSNSGVHFELHFSLTETTSPEKEKVLFNNIFDKAVGETYKKSLTDEINYCYHFSHIAKHLRYGGCGIRAVLDTMILNEAVVHDRQKRERLLEETGLLKLSKAIEKLSRVWFDGEMEDETSKVLSDFIILGGVYGDFKNKVIAQQTGKRNKVTYLFSRLFLPYEQMKYKYPKLQKRPILYPFYVVKRWFLMLNKDARTLAKKEVNQTINRDDKQEEIIKTLKELGL